MRRVPLGLLLVLVAAGCHRAPKLESKEAVQAAIEAHLKEHSGIALASMTVEVEDVKFAGDSAEAQVRYRSKETPTLTVGMRYSLRRAGDHWEVFSSSSSGAMGGNPHGAAAEPVQGEPAAAPPGEAPQPSH